MPNDTHMLFFAVCRSHNMPEPIAEFQFHPTRRWRFDYAWPVVKVALEVEGGLYGRGKKCSVCGQRKGMGHSSVSGMLRDIEKYNEALLHGWRVLRVVPDQLHTKATAQMLTSLIN